MLFVVVNEKEDSQLDQYPHVVLVRDNWDDYGYQTTFISYLYLSANQEIKLGVTKILKEDQAGGSTPIVNSPFNELDQDYCSVGYDISEYYEVLFKLDSDIYKPYLMGLRDVAFDDEIKARFEDHEGFRVSLLRAGRVESLIRNASLLFRENLPPVSDQNDGLTFSFKTKVANNSNSFITLFDFKKSGLLPNRVNALIGYNGTGKTRLLANLAIAASGYGYDLREDAFQQTAGRFVGESPAFKTTVVVSYSAFDNFIIPGKNQEEKARLKETGEVLDYVYCGLRERIEANDDSYRLKPHEEIEREFSLSLKWIRDEGRLEPFINILKPLFSDPSFERIGFTALYSPDVEHEVIADFQKLSSGHKSVIKILTDLTAHIDGKEPTLVLIDEPETHLHPPLLAAFLKSLRICLDLLNGYAIIATHSPVILQETPSRFVQMLRRTMDQSSIEKVAMETFGESIGTITQDVFNLGDGSTDWHGTLEALSHYSSLEDIEQMFGKQLGFSARSYLLSFKAGQEND